MVETSRRQGMPCLYNPPPLRCGVVDRNFCRDKACLVSLFSRCQHPQRCQQSPQMLQTAGQKRSKNQGKNTISSIIGGYKSVVSNHAHRLGYNFKWQSRFYDHIIRGTDEYRKIANYIVNNPVNWGKDKFYST